MTTRPRIGVDALFLEQPMTGAGQYALNLWRQLRDHQSAFTPVALLPADASPSVRAEVGDHCVCVAPPLTARHGKARKLWWEQMGLPLATRRADCDLVHIPYFSAPLRLGAPFVVTVHDVIPLVLPAYGGSGQMRAYMRLVSRTVKRARRVLTDSEHAKGDIVRQLGIAPNQICVVPLAASEEFHPLREDGRADVERTLRDLRLTRPFVLNVGGFDLRKRLPQLVQGFAAALPKLPVDCDLVITGRPHTANPALYPALQPLIDELSLHERVHLPGFVSEEDKRNLYRACEVFVFPSEYEGFGLNPLEAMRCGAPVICSNRASLPEVVGDAGYLIDPEPAAITDALIAVLNEPSLRADLVRRSLQQAAAFSWERTAQETMSVYQEILEA